jgi:hypothetical protein
VKKPLPKKSRPGLTEKIFFRCSTEFRECFDELAEKEQIDMSEMIRYLVESGMARAIEGGLPMVMADRKKLLVYLEKKRAH